MQKRRILRISIAMLSGVASNIPLTLFQRFTLCTVSSSVTWDTRAGVTIPQIITCSVVLARPISAIINVCKKKAKRTFSSIVINIIEFMVDSTFIA